MHARGPGFDSRCRRFFSSAVWLLLFTKLSIVGGRAWLIDEMLSGCARVLGSQLIFTK